MSNQAFLATATGRLVAQFDLPADGVICLSLTTSPHNFEGLTDWLAMEEDWTDCQVRLSRVEREEVGVVEYIRFLHESGDAAVALKIRRDRYGESGFRALLDDWPTGTGDKWSELLLVAVGKHVGEEMISFCQELLPEWIHETVEGQCSYAYELPPEA